MKTLEQQIQELTDREEIKELTAHYAHGVARGEGARVAALFTDDGESHRAHLHVSGATTWGCLKIGRLYSFE